MSKDAVKPRAKTARIPSTDEQKAQAEKDMVLIKMHMLFDGIEDILNHKVYSTQNAENVRSLLLCTRHVAIKTFISDYAETPTTVGSLGI